MVGSNTLSNRTQFVAANDFDSSPRAVGSGEPHASVLGAPLFLICINDLTNSVNSCIELFADDCVMFRVISSSADTFKLQPDLKTSTWYDTWKMSLNTNKCKVMQITLHYTTPTVTL